MSFQQGLSGLGAAAKALDAISNNVANASTAGYKASQAQFSDVFAASLSGAGSGQVGIGTQIASVRQQFTQGNIEVTNNAMDLAINGGGFFRMSNNGTITYTRNGQFLVDKENYIVNSLGSRLTGYAANATGAILQSSPVELQISRDDLDPSATTDMDMSLNLDSRDAVIAGAIDIDDPTTYNVSTAATVYDSLGVAHTLTIFFQKTAANDWNIAYGLNGTDITSTAAGTSVQFDATGTVSGGGTTTFSIPSATLGTGAADLDFTLDVTAATQFGSAFGVNDITQDGYSSGRLTGISVSDDGIVQGRYSNGLNRNLGQIVLVAFNNPNGLQPLGGNQWAETAQSGAPLVNSPGSSNLGLLQSGAIETANVDLTAELVAMITAQRNYQANAQSIKTQDSILQTLVNLR